MIRLLVLLLFILGFDWFIFQSLKPVLFSWGASTTLVISGLYWSVYILLAIWFLIIATGALRQISRERYTLIRSIFMIIYFSKFIILLVLLTDDIRIMSLQAYEYFFGETGYGSNRSPIFIKAALLLGAIPLVTLTYGILRNRHRYQIHNVDIPIINLPAGLDGLKIIQLSDIHSGSFTRKAPVQQAIDLINEQEPDIVLFTGDLVNNVAKEMAPFIDIFGQIRAKYGTYSVLGNHDYGDYVRWNSMEEKQQNFRELLSVHQQMGWDLLLNEHRTVEINGQQVALIGVENYSAHPRFAKYGDLNQAVIGLKDADLKILLSHDPTHWEDQVIKAPFQDIDLTLSGHTHGFQFGIEIPGWFRWSPAKYIYKQWAGLYKKGEQYLYVNRGFGYLGYPGRVGILPEITVLNLRKDD